MPDRLQKERRTSLFISTVGPSGSFGTQSEVPGVVELVLPDKSELRHVDGDLPLHPSSGPTIDRPKADDLDATRPLRLVRLLR